MLNLDIKLRDEIVRILPSLVVSASVGATLMDIARALASLKEIEKKSDEKTNA